MHVFKNKKRWAK